MCTTALGLAFPITSQSDMYISSVTWKLDRKLAIQI